MNIPQKKAARRDATLARWPELPLASWQATCETLHMWTQIVGKVRLECSPYINHWWQVPFYITALGLTTSPIPYKHGIFEITFDFVDHQLLIQTSTGTSRAIPLAPRSVATFYQEVMDALRALDINVQINTLPQEVKHPIRFPEDTQHAAYDPVFANRFWQILIQTETVLKRYRSSFIGKSSPIHFFWGSFDLALTFFNGRRAPERAGIDKITREAYSHEVISAGFWPGNADFPQPAFYSYTMPAPPGLEKAAIQPNSAHYNSELGEFLLLYDDVRRADAPDETLLAFYQSTYETGAHAAQWDQRNLERAT
jgi:hypothetical protein